MYQSTQLSKSIGLTQSYRTTHTHITN